MTPDDAQIDILLRRYASRAESSPAHQHLDADELNTFAEGAVPAEARSRYVSHLADCSDCRRLVSQLAMASGAAVLAASAAPLETKAESWRQRVAAFFRPPTLRYAAFALVLVAAGATVFVVMRRPRESAFLARNESLREEPSTYVKPIEAPQPDQNSIASSKVAPSATQAPQNLNDADKKLDQSRANPSPAATPKPAVDSLYSLNPAIAKEDTKRSTNEPVTAYAPQPPGETERQQPQSREQKELQSGAAGGLQKSEADKLKTKEQSRVAEFGIAKDRRAGPNDNSNQRNQQAVTQNTLSDTTNAPRSEPAQTAGRRAGTEERPPAAKAAASATRDDEEKTQETRSAGGHKFRRQGNTWVDTKYKPSMPIMDVSRDSDQYRALSSSVKSVVEQLGSGVIVVSKGKAYRIR